MIVLYLVVAVIALSFHGWLPTKIETPAGGAGTAPVTEQTNAISEQTRAIEELTDTVTEGLADIDGRLTAIARRLDIEVDTAGHGDDRG